ncbi:AMP-binding enzyme family protein [Mycobacterium xenopi 4042]|uniref:AMP-binding enzyme family protein n=1 Tax=Mycobacterium xenopi 4042 TaxID=1299334 RepID=X8AMU3_MYCXE|nr:AMP-binding enzyme family protein [Mycobacterium xenopi 4042]
MLAVLKTGAGYVPIDPAMPATRVGFMLADAAPIAVVTTAALRPRLDDHDLVVIDIDDPTIAGYPATALPTPADDDIAYLIYTSGTTGAPKGGRHPPQRDSATGLPASAAVPGRGVDAVSLV